MAINPKPGHTKPGHSLPPETPHAITVHLPGWDSAVRLRKGDKEIHESLVSMYPRFAPLSKAKELCAALHKLLRLPAELTCIPFINADVFRMAQEHLVHHVWKDGVLEPAEVSFRVVDVPGVDGRGVVRLYVLVFPAAKKPAIIGIWSNPGIIVSSRLAESCLEHVDDFVVNPWSGTAADAPEAVSPGSGEGFPSPPGGHLPEVEAHQKLRERIVGLLKRATVVEEPPLEVEPDDVYLFPTGMSAIYRLQRAILATRGGPIVALGSIFHSTWHLFAEAGVGFKHFGRCDAGSRVMEELEEYLKAEAEQGRKLSFLFLEFPSNPILVSADLKRLRELAHKYDFPVVIDETVGSMCNIDVLPVADVLMSSLTKSFSGYADVMGGTFILNRTSPHYTLLKQTLTSTFRNEFFSRDAQQLLSNSADYLARSKILNRNAMAVATFMQSHIDTNSPTSPVTAVLYPPLSDTFANYRAFMRRPTPEFPEPGYGCLLSIDFEDKDCARAFFDNLEAYNGPHLGAHLTLAINFNEMLWGLDPKDEEYHASYGSRCEQVRISVGLEDENELIERFTVALRAAEKEKVRKAQEGGLSN